MKGMWCSWSKLSAPLRMVWHLLHMRHKYTGIIRRAKRRPLLVTQRGRYLYEQPGSCALSSTNLSDHGESQQAAETADYKQNDLTPVAFLQVIGEMINQWCHHALHTNKLEEMVHRMTMKYFILFFLLLIDCDILADTWLSSPSRMIMRKKHTDHTWGIGIIATARG